MLNECINALNIEPSGLYVDVTFGGGGHSKEILKHLNKKGKLIAFDQDEDARKNLPEDNRLIFIDQNFEFMENHLQYQELTPVNGILADLGVSSHQFDDDQRGFSYKNDDVAIDMRMNTHIKHNAAYLLNSYNVQQLAEMFYYYGELKNSKQIAAAVEQYRNIKPIHTIGEFKDAIKQQTPKFNEYKFYAKVFQALRIEVNKELDVLKKFLQQAANVLIKDGRIAVISYHSLEDRLVKNFFNTGNFNGHEEKDFFGNTIKPLAAINKQVITPSQTEIELNTRSRSAKLRVAKKI